MSAERDLDVVLYGATGFVGRLTARYLAQHAPEGARIALAGRSEPKLASVRGELGARAADWPLLVADSAGAAALAAIAARARAVATTVGPYQRYGIPLVQACAEAGTHYADLTGEVLFMREVIDRFDAAARESGARIVHTCGFDSIPSDLGVLALHRAVQRDGAGELEDTTLVVERLSGGLSGGTLDSLRGQLDEMRRDPAKRKLASDPYALSPDRAAEPDLGKERELQSVERNAELGWLAPFVMAGVNTRVVRRSNALQGHAYGSRFRYREVMSGGSGPLAPVRAGAIVGLLGGLVAGMSFGPTRSLLDRVLPAPGEGPSEKTQRRGFYEIAIHGTTTSGRRYVTRVAQKGDPGYAATAVLLGESALCLALDADRLPEGGGVLTPATAMGDVLMERLRLSGVTIDTE
ncbi:MAG TPA: saccharopine dehydrogenase NADP-binding domain-containing protein [Solirubrobacteraceae bacterium]|nr:saccharopine dehydrogenase NADP-binding domain-containing protein [Solirubrobacteraceae bacterium]